MKNKSRSDAFCKSRITRASVTAEDYTEMIADLQKEKGEARIKDLAREMGVSHVTCLRTVQRLREEGFIKKSPQVPIELTKKGLELACFCKERHSILYSFLCSIGVSEKTAAIDVEGLEHYVSPETLEAIRKAL